MEHDLKDKAVMNEAALPTEGELTAEQMESVTGGLAVSHPNS